MKYTVVSAVVTDEIHFPDGTVKVVPGGAGIYALAGIRLWSDEVLVVTGVGKDYETLHGPWYRRNNLSMDGLRVKDKKSAYTMIQYFDDGERTETSRYGADHFRMLETTWLELKPHLEHSEGMYIFKNLDAYFWMQVLKMKKSSHCKIMWEIGADATFPENLEKIRDIAGQLEGFSINYTEAKSLLGTDSLEEMIQEFQNWGTDLIFLRRGAAGAVMITKADWVEVPSQPNVDVVDPTGGGNSSTGGVLCGMVEGCSPEICGRMGSISAAMCIGQYGVPKQITEGMRNEAKKQLK